MRKPARISIVAICFLCLLGVTALVNIKIIKEPTQALLSEKTDFYEYTEQIEENYRTKIKWKNAFIDLNGLYSRMIGNRTCNDVVRLNNGMLLNERQQIKQDARETGSAAVEFADWLKKRNIDYFYVMTPYKVDLKNEVLPVWEENHTNAQADELLQVLAENQVDFLDLRQSFSATPEQVEKNFYTTDHHWKNTTAFEAFRTLATYMQQRYPEQVILSDRTDIENWNIYTEKNCFLGSAGERVGKYYAGLDDLTWLVPKFETDIAAMQPYQNVFRAGSFADSELIEDNFRKQHTYYGYVGDNHFLTKHRNLSATSDLKILLLKDSYSVPFQSFLATVFQEVDALDLRCVDNTSVVEYIDQTKPDLVIQMQYPIVSAKKDPFFLYGMEDLSEVEKKRESERVLWKDEIVIPATESDHNNAVILGDLKAGTKYTVQFENPCFTNADNRGFSIVVRGTETHQEICADMFDKNYQEMRGGLYEWTFYTPEDTGEALELILYSGVRGYTQNIGLTVQNVQVEAFQ